MVHRRRYDFGRETIQTHCCYAADTRGPTKTLKVPEDG